MVDSLCTSQEDVREVWGRLAVGKKDIVLPTVYPLPSPDVSSGGHLIYDLGLSLKQIQFAIGNNTSGKTPFWEPRNHCIQSEGDWINERVPPSYWILKSPIFGSLKWRWQEEEIGKRYGFQRAPVRLIAFAVVSFALICGVDFLGGEDHWGGHLESLKKGESPNKEEITSAVVLAYRNGSLSIYRRVLEDPHAEIACCMAKKG